MNSGDASNNQVEYDISEHNTRPPSPTTEPEWLIKQEEKMTIEETDTYKHQIINNWEDYELNTDLLRGIYNYGFENPSEIQKRAILPILQKQDVIAQAQSGSGKTGTFSIGTLQRIDVTENKTQAIILAPTHELAKQISTVIAALGSSMKGLVIKTMLGGSSIQADKTFMQETTPHIVVGCAGRILDMIRRKILSTTDIRLCVVDEADEMLSRGFKEQLQNIFRYFQQDVQIALFSATLPEDVLLLTDKFMKQPVKITMKKENLNLECIKQYFVAIQDDRMKFDTLKDLFSFISVSQCIIYCNSVNRVMDLAYAMNKDGFSVCAIHSSMDKSEREQTFAEFRHGKYRVLISSNVTARGIDIQQVSTVINFDIPNCVHTYLHRIGRSGRWGRKGMAINFMTQRDVVMMKRIESHYKISIDELPASVI
jgi:translation initiation factor 4A